MIDDNGGEGGNDGIKNYPREGRAQTIFAFRVHCAILFLCLRVDHSLAKYRRAREEKKGLAGSIELTGGGGGGGLKFKPPSIGCGPFLS